MSIPIELEGILVSTPDTLHGALRFAGSRVFAQSLFDYVLGGKRVEEFLNHFPDVSREQADAVLESYRKRLCSELGFDQVA